MNNDRPNTGFVYYRVSDDKQVEGYSLEQQKKSCEALAKSRGIKVTGYFVDEGESATTKNRKHFLKMLDECEKKEVRCVIVFHTDRFARNALEHALIKDQLAKLGVDLLSVCQPMIDASPEGKLLDTMMAGINQFYSDDLGRKTKRGMHGRWEQGWINGRVSLGYMNVKKNRITESYFTVAKQKYLEELGRALNPVELDPFVAPYIKQAFEMYATNNYSYFHIGQFLFKKGLKTANGKPLAHSTIHQIITNPFYYGLLRAKGEEDIMGKHEPLIDVALFKHCQLIAARKRHFILRQRKHDFLLRGVIFCNRCGQRYTAEWHKLNSVSSDKIAYYHCAKRQPCKSPYIEMNEMECLVENELLKVKFSDEFVQALSNKVKDYLDTQGLRNNSTEQLLVKRRAELKTQKSELLSYLVNKVIDKDDFTEKKAELDSEIENINEEISKIDRSSNFDFDLLEEVLKLTLDIPATYAEAPTVLKRHFLKFFFRKVKVDNKKIQKVEYSDLLSELISCQQVIVISPLLPG